MCSLARYAGPFTRSATRRVGYDTWPAMRGPTLARPTTGRHGTRQAARHCLRPTGSASADFYGANRVGDNLFANTLLALDAQTGKRLWHFQAVKHDIWDRDFPLPPHCSASGAMAKDRCGGPDDKQGFVFVFDRVTGVPLFPVEYRSVPPSTVPGEVASPTQPFPLKPAPFARQTLTEDLLTTRTPEMHRWAVEHFETFRAPGNSCR